MFLQSFLPKQSQKQSLCIAQTGSKSSPGTKPSLPLRFGKMWNLASSLQNSRRTALTPVISSYIQLYPVMPCYTSCTKQNMAMSSMSLSPTSINQHPSPSITYSHFTQPGNHRRKGSARGAHGLWSDPAEVGEKHFPRSSQYLWRTRRT